MSCGDEGNTSAATAKNGIASTKSILSLALVSGCCALAVYAVETPPMSTTTTLNVDLGNSVVMKLALIPSGAFLMGSPENESGRTYGEGPQHEITISKPFYMGIYTVTQAQWEQVMGTDISQQKDKARNDDRLPGVGPNYPMYYVSWDETQEFCKRLSQKTGRTVRLPTEAQWEYACRAGTKTPVYYGNDESYIKLGDYAWEFRNSKDTSHAVGMKKPNAWGLYDMYGNVFQWCSDYYDEEYYEHATRTDPQGPESGNQRVLRGGCWYGSPWGHRSAARCWHTPDARSCFYGFRVIVEVR